MSNIEKNYIDIPDLSCFDKNRVHEVKELNVNNSYLGIGIKNEASYVYAIKSSPNYYSLQPQHKSDAYIYVRHNDNNSNQSYSFYRGYSYTYTEGLSANNQKMALIAYQFVNRTADNSITLYDIDTKLTHIALNGATETAPCHVNEKSDTSYFLRKQNESNNIEIDESSVKLGNIKNNLVNDTYTKFNTYCKYSALNPSDYIIHDDCEFNMNMGAYVWNLIDGHDMKPYSYTTLTDTTKLTAYAYIDCEDSLHSFFRSQSQIFDYDVTHYKYIDFNYDNINVSGQQWKLGTNGTSSSYVYDNNINYAQFYANAKHNLPSHATDSFENIINHPSYRNNYGVVDSYINIKGLSQPSGTESIDISQNSQNNYNTAKFIKRIKDLPVHMIPNNLRFKISVQCGHINGGQIGGGGSITLNKIMVSFNTEKNSQDLMTIFNGTISFTVITDSNNNIYAHEISCGESEYLKVVENGIYEVTADEIGAAHGDISQLEAYVIYEFQTDKIYGDFESGYPNKTIRGLYIEGTNDITIHASGTSVAHYASIMSNYFVLEGNTNYTGDYRGKITNSNDTEQIGNGAPEIEIGFGVNLPNE